MSTTLEEVIFSHAVTTTTVPMASKLRPQQILLTPKVSLAAEDGVSFWLPGTFSSLAAVPGTPGFSFSTFGYNTNVSAGANVAAAREIEIGALNPTLRANLSATLHADSGFDFFDGAYVFATPVLGGQASDSKPKW